MKVRYIYHIDLGKLLLFITITLFLYNCSDNPVKKYYTYYETGELLSEDVLIKIEDNEDSIFYTKEYNKQGYVIAEGHYRGKGVTFGIWHFYFSDGELQWRGEMHEGRKIIPDSIWVNMEKQPAWIEIEGHPKVLKVGGEYKFRTYIEGVMPDGYDVMTDSEFFRIYTNKVDPERFPLIIIPEKAGVFGIMLMLPEPDTTAMIVVGKKYLYFPIVVEE